MLCESAGCINIERWKQNDLYFTFMLSPVSFDYVISTIQCLLGSEVSVTSSVTWES